MQLLKPYIEFDHQQRWQITDDYRVVHRLNGHIFVQNQEMHSHGVGTPDLGLGAYRAATIINQLLAEPLYELGNQAQTFQHFNLSQNPKFVWQMTKHNQTSAFAKILPIRTIQFSRKQNRT